MNNAHSIFRDGKLTPAALYLIAEPAWIVENMQIRRKNAL